MQGLAVGQKFERYRVLRFLGNGVSGESYEAEDTSLQRIVLLKLIHPWLMLSDSIRRQFFRDMQHISSVTHPYLATILDYGEVDRQLYIARSYIGPGSLLSTEGRMRFNPPLPPTDAITYTHQLAQSLQHLHDHGLTHGSLTFSNIMVVGSPDQATAIAPFLLTDPGTACFVRRFGTPKITLFPISAAPEHLEKHFIPAGDQYALATLLYIWLAGRPPFIGSPDTLQQQKLTETITPLTLLNRQISSRQEEIIRRALRCIPEKRYPSILAFAEELVASLQQSAHTIFPEETPPHITSTSNFTTTQSLITRPDTVQPAEQTIEQHTDELPQIEQETPPGISHEQEAPSTIQAYSRDKKEPAAHNDLESLMTSLLQANLPVSPGSSYPTIADAYELPAAEPTYLSGMLDTETTASWQSIVVQERPAPPQPSTEPDIPQPLPQPERTPEPQPEPRQPPAPKTPSEPEKPPVILPQPEPDIAHPLPETAPTLPEKPVAPPQQPNPDKQQVQDGQKIAPHLFITSHYLAQPREVPLENELITIGRAGSSDILLDYDNLTSRHHAILKYEREQYVIFDQRSAQGVYVNGQKLTAGVGWRLTDGDTITIGAYTLVFYVNREMHSQDQISSAI